MNNKFNKLCSFPNWKPELWNENVPDNIKDYTNCYSYALNRVEFNINDKLQPGELSGGKYDNMDCNTILNHIKKDLNRNDIKKSSNSEKLDCLHYKIALAIDKEHDEPDYHFYREDNDGSWSHKPGGNKATNLDASDNLINDPYSADRDYSHKEYTNDDGELEYGKNYKIFCGYYSIPINKGPVLYNWDTNTEYKINLDTNLNNFILKNNWENRERDDDNNNSNNSNNIFNINPMVDFTSLGSYFIKN
tara:strand:- start:12572 stop:13315 length:744 start_codon:yes stop_codon:yes gene_type:complete